MSPILASAAVVALLLAAYLVVAMLAPEWFG
ncbi:MAG: potassium-transporting ATPase subunit F [Planctomycetota bacterium]|jgi:K+-transporting ATPase KdpF subunit|nr:MAG: potassium-transporting ATPase subunit F [Planctomycetota bacterium]